MDIAGITTKRMEGHGWERVIGKVLKFLLAVVFLWDMSVYACATVVALLDIARELW